MENVYLDWALEQRGKEHVSFPTFVKNFGLTNRESSTRLFESLLQSSRIPSNRRAFLNDRFDKFQKHHLEQFWTTYYLRLNSERTAQRLALAAQDTAVEEAEAAYADRRNTIAASALADPRRSKSSVESSAGAGPEVSATGESVHVTTVFDSAEKHSLEEDDISPPAKKQKDKKSADDRRRSLQRRFSSLGRKWTLRSGTVVEDVLFEAGQSMNELHPIHSFMIDLSDKATRQLFCKDDWAEISTDLPDIPPYSKEASEYLDKFDRVATLEDLQDLLDRRPRDTESQLIYECLLNWVYLYETDDPSPFSVAGGLSEDWWLKSAWSVCSNTTWH